jgi:hypothetical protein
MPLFFPAQRTVARDRDPPWPLFPAQLTVVKI